MSENENAKGKVMNNKDLIKILRKSK